MAEVTRLWFLLVEIADLGLTSMLFFREAWKITGFSMFIVLAAVHFSASKGVLSLFG